MKLMMIINVIIAIFGIYMVISSVKMKRSGEISSMVLAPEEIQKCKDKIGFINFMYWREIIFGITLMFAGMIGTINEVYELHLAVKVVELIVFIGIFAWFWHGLSSARTQFIKKF